MADAGGNGLDFDALLQRIHPAESRVDRLAAETPASFVAFDLLAARRRDAARRCRCRERRALLEIARRAERRRSTSRPPARPRDVADDWFGRFEGAGLDGVIAKPLDGTYEPDKRTLIKVKHERTADCVVAGYRIHKDGKGVGSLLLGLFDDEGDLHHVGVAAAFTREARGRSCSPSSSRCTHDALDDHPWRDWAEWDGARRTVEGEPGRAAGGTPARTCRGCRSRIGLVAEVTFGQLENGRFRHGVKFLRWRPDRTPESCRYDQLDVADPISFAEFIAR